MYTLIIKKVYSNRSCTPKNADSVVVPPFLTKPRLPSISNQALESAFFPFISLIRKRYNTPIKKESYPYTVLLI